VAALRSIFREDITSYAAVMSLRYDPDAITAVDAGQSQRIETAWVLRQVCVARGCVVLVLRTRGWRQFRGSATACCKIQLVLESANGV